MTPSDWRGLWVIRNGGFAKVNIKGWHLKTLKNIGGTVPILVWTGWILTQDPKDKKWIPRGLKAWDSKGDHVKNREWDLMIRKRGDEPKVLFQGTWKEWPILW